MDRRSLRIVLALLALLLAQCSNTNNNTTSGPPTAFTTLRLNATSGAGDNSFGPNQNAVVVTDIDPTIIDFALAIAIQPADNKIVVGGSNGATGQGQVALVRYNPDGSGDNTFGTGGIVKTSQTTPAAASAIAVQADGKIVVCAVLSAAAAASPTGFNTSLVVIRYNTNGTPDNSFGTNGITTALPIGNGLAEDTCSMLLQGGNIVVAGAAQDGKLVLARYTSVGALDATFGTSLTTPGTTVVTALGAPSIGPVNRPAAMAAQSDGRIIVATRNGDSLAVLRFSAIGAQDTTFGGVAGGIVTTFFGAGAAFANAVMVQSSGAPANVDKIVVVGHAFTTGSTSDIALVRYSKDGVPEAAFGPNGNGIVTTDIANQYDNALAAVLQDQAGGEPKILVAGNTGFNGFVQTVVLRYNADGSLDTSFGSRGTGLVFVPVIGPSVSASGNAMAIQPGLGIVVTGYD